MISVEDLTARSCRRLPKDVPLEHWGLQLLRMAALLDRLNECKHHERKGDPNDCLQCHALFLELSNEVFLSHRYLVNGNYFRPDMTRRHIDPQPPNAA